MTCGAWCVTHGPSSMEGDNMDLKKFGQSLVDQADELRWLRAENERLMLVEAKYQELLRSSLQHSEQMMGGLLSLLVKPGIAEALMPKEG